MSRPDIITTVRVLYGHDQARRGPLWGRHDADEVEHERSLPALC
jgi:hypothetical protein